MAETTSRLKIATPLIVMLVLMAGWSGWWWWASQFAETKLAEARNQYADRFSLTCAQEEWGGYPYRIMFTCRDAEIGLKRQGTILRLPKLDILAQAYNPSHIIARLTGPSEIANSRQSLTLTAEHLPLVTGVKFKNARFTIASSRIKDLTIRQADVTVLTAGTAALHLRPAEGRPGFDLAGDANTVAVLPDTPQGVPVDRIEAQANIDKLPPGGHRNLAELARAAALAQSIFTLDSLEARSNGIVATASGQASIDRQGSITGSLKTRLKNPDQLFAELTSRGVVKEKQARAASALLGLFKSEDGIAADLRFKNGTIYWGPIKLGRHAPLF